MDKQRKSIAPNESGEFANEKRCKQCWRLLTIYEDERGISTPWCAHCQRFYKDKVKD